MAQYLTVVLLALPAFSAVSGFFAGSKCPSIPRYLSLAVSALVLALALYLSFDVSRTFSLGCPWFALGRLCVDFYLEYNPLSSLMILIVAFVGFAVHLFSVHYMREDTAQPRYYAALSLFVFSMIGLALSANLLMLFVFWEMVGFGSYLLIGHYGTKEAGEAANKAFLVNRIGDIFFLLGIIFIVCQTSSLNIGILSQKAATMPHSLLKAIALLVFAGVVTKSAQFPGHLWLPDAMAGPTPISALIHAATMVAAGIFLLCRMEFLFAPILHMIGYLGAFTALFAAFCAFGKTDIKKVLAYSTISQLGFMAAGFGLGSSSAAFFHLTTHAFFKSLLFLAAGAVLTACHHEQDARKLGGLWKKMPFTFVVFLVGALALSGFPLTAGFFSKDTILLLALSHNGFIFAILMLSSLMTALYMGRIIGLTFLGRPESPAAEHASEGSSFYYVPLALLALGALVAGYIILYPHFTSGVFARLPSFPENYWMLAWSLAVVGVAVWVAFIYAKHGQEPLEKTGGLYESLRESFYVDRIWHKTGLGCEMFARALGRTDERALRGFFHRGMGGLFGQAGNFAKAAYVRLLTVSLYWILAGALLLVLLLASYCQ